jgi:exonuclease III
MVLSELSSGDGSLALVDSLATAGYAVHWIRPQGREYAVALAISERIPHRLLKWDAAYGRSRAQFALIRLGGIEHCIGGVYAPSLNPGNTEKRMDFFNSLEGLLTQAVVSGRPVLFGGDINEIPPWHIPRIANYHAEGYPFHRQLSVVGLADLAKKFLPPRSYSWFDRHGAGQLLDAAYVSQAHAHLVSHYEIDAHFLKSKLSDHCGLRVNYGPTEN